MSARQQNRKREERAVESERKLTEKRNLENIAGSRAGGRDIPLMELWRELPLCLVKLEGGAKMSRDNN